MKARGSLASRLPHEELSRVVSGRQVDQVQRGQARLSSGARGDGKDVQRVAITISNSGGCHSDGSDMMSCLRII